MMAPWHARTFLGFLATAASLFGCAKTAHQESFNERFEVGPNQQLLIASMVGEGTALPSGCTMAQATFARTYFQVRYACAGLSQPATIEFRHREVAPRGSVVTAQFTLIPFGARGVPPDLLTAIVARVRTQEGQWRWVGHGQGGPIPPPRGPPVLRPAPAVPYDVPVPHDVPALRLDVPAPPAVPAPLPVLPVRVGTPDAGARLGVTPTPPPPPAPTADAGPALVAPASPSLAPPLAPLGPTISAPAEDLRERGPGSVGLLDVLNDGVLLYLAGLVFVLLAIRRQLRDIPSWVGPALAGVVLGGAVLRFALAPVAPLNAWSYSRIIPLARHSYDGVVLPLLSRLTGATFRLNAVNFAAGIAIAAATPLVLFAHARYVLKDWRSALAAAAILAALPLHLRFSHSDVEILQTLLTSSLTFVVLYGALTDDSARWRAACFIALPLLCVATYYSRPEAIIFFPLDLGGVAIAWTTTPRARRALAAVLVSAAAVFSVFTHLLVRYRQNLDDGLSLRTLRTAFDTLLSPRFNMLLSPWSTPPGLVVAAVIGAVYLWRQGERARAVFLVLWLLAFFVVHSYVIPTVPAMQARYHLNLVTPFVLLAAAATPALLRAPTFARIGAALYLLASPWLHRGFIRDVDYFEMREFAFLESVRGRIPDRCTVLEFQPALSTADPTRTHASRLARVGARIRGGVTRWAWNIVPLGEIAPARSGEEPREVLSAAARAVIQRPPPCLMVYLGLTCRSHRPLATPVAPVCEEVRAALDLEPVSETRFRSNIYDSVSVGRIVVGPDGRTQTTHALENDSEVALGLYRQRR